MNPPLELKINEVYMLLGEKDVLIYQLGEQFNKVSMENVELKKRITELENEQLEQPDDNNRLRRIRSGNEGS